MNVPIAEQRSTDEVVVSMSRPMSQDKFTELNRNAQVLEPLNNPTTPIITPASIIVNDTEENDDPPPYSAIVPPNHVGWPYNLFSSGNSYYTDATSCRVEIPLAPFQTSLTPYFHPEGTNGHHHPSIPMPATPYQFFKFDCRRNSSTRRETSFSSDGVAEKINDRKSRRKYHNIPAYNYCILCDYSIHVISCTIFSVYLICIVI